MLNASVESFGFGSRSVGGAEWGIFGKKLHVLRRAGVSLAPAKTEVSGSGVLPVQAGAAVVPSGGYFRQGIARFA